MESKVRMISPVERALFLRTLDPLGSFSPAELATVSQQARERFFRKGTRIFRRGEPVGSLHIVVEGRVRVEGSEYGEGVVGPEESLGGLSLLSRWPEGLDAVAETDTLTLEIEADDMSDLLEDHFSVLHQTIRDIGSRMLSLRKQTREGAYLAPAEGLEAAPHESLDLIERLLYLRRGQTFRSANTDALIEMARGLEEVRFERGTTLWEQGEPSGFIYLIVLGTVRAVLDGGERFFWCGPGYPLGNLESMAGEPRWFRAVAETSVVALRGESEGFFDILEDHFEMALNLLSNMATNLIEILQANRRTSRSESA